MYTVFRLLMASILILAGLAARGRLLLDDELVLLSRHGRRRGRPGQPALEPVQAGYLVVQRLDGVQAEQAGRPAAGRLTGRLTGRRFRAGRLDVLERSQVSPDVALVPAGLRRLGARLVAAFGQQFPAGRPVVHRQPLEFQVRVLQRRRQLAYTPHLILTLSLKLWKKNTITWNEKIIFKNLSFI